MRAHILEALREAGGVVAGRFGAAARLGLKRSTLVSKMVRLGIASGNVTRVRAQRPATLSSH
jgi:transcriptional regulator with GAF, ATPase, and Fis domain